MTGFPMIALLPVVLFLSIMFQMNLTRTLEPTSQVLHQWCNSWFDPKLDPKNLTVSFICGKKVTDSNQKILLQKSGLYHAIVVSGGHFIFLESILKRCGLPHFIRLFILWIYYLMTGLQAPGLRCLVQMGVSLLGNRMNFKMNAITLGFYSGMLCLSINYQLWQSLSFWLSFAVSLALAIAAELQTAKDRVTPFLLPLILIYVFLIPFNFSNGYLHPLNLILGILLVYPFSAILLMQSVLIALGNTLAINGFFKASSLSNEWLFFALKKWTLVIPNKNMGQPDLFGFWVYLIILLIGFHFICLWMRREIIHE